MQLEIVFEIVFVVTLRPLGASGRNFPCAGHDYLEIET